MTEWFLSIEGTSSGRTVAFGLAIMAAILHAVLGAMQKGKFDPWTSRAFIDINYCLLSLPFALFVFPFPEPEVWRVLCFGVIAHAIYKILMAMAFSRAAFTVVYPVVRGTGPLVTVLFAGVVFNEIFTLQQWIGITVLSIGIFGLALYNLWKIQGPREQLPLALIIALVTGVTVAIYTTVDAYGVRLSASPFSYLAWLFVLDGFIMPIIWLGWKRKPEHIKALPNLLGRGFIGGLFAVGSFGSIMLATRLDQVGKAAVLRETSTVFAALIGWILLRETVGPRRFVLISMIAIGAIIVEFGI
ncbi:MAG: EamA family transporter [Rhodobacteraceae bacterium]|nr:DMT family transporter [Paracoccaceae bacterium]MXZ49516.1 EamA family transporter [Paracoccaceae bacterium]MYF45927.1 EamA family transporter [Paracoccaceae bacterium]MYI91450.1 EamA family transporter [Paracoccaceae bacterium]